MPSRAQPLPVLAGIGLAIGFFSALFGVGGGTVAVPMLILLLGFEGRRASGTSLAIIGFTALFGAAGYAILGAVEWRDAALLGLPAVVGALGGTWLQQRITSRALLALFALFLLAVAVRLFLE